MQRRLALLSLLLFLDVFAAVLPIAYAEQNVVDSISCFRFRRKLGVAPDASGSDYREVQIDLVEV